jgi:hypothetical protein
MRRELVLLLSCPAVNDGVTVGLEYDANILKKYMRYQST